MKFKDFINETPALVDIENDPALARRQYDRDMKSSNKKEYEWGEYKVIEVDSKHEVVNTYLIKDDNLQLYIAYTLPNIKNLGKMIQNTYIQKANGATIGTAVIIEFIMMMIKDKKAQGIISDDIQSAGGKKLWRSILQHGEDNKKDIGVYNNFDNTVHPKEKEKKFALWYAIRSREVYGTDLEKAQYQLYLKK